MSRTFITLAALTACATTPSPRSPTVATDANKRIVRSIYEDYINPGQLDQLATLVAPDYVAPQTGDHGQAAFVANIRELRAGFPDIHFTIDDLVAEGDRVAIRWSWRATHTGPFRHLPPSGRAITNTGMAVYQLAAGKVTHSWVETDRLGALQQMGALPAPPAR
jgi:predicted ester cyclase